MRSAEVFATERLSLPVHQIARRAGVGTGTVSRDFSTKETLFAAVPLDRVALLCAQGVAPSLGGPVAFAAATAEVDGPAAGLTRLDELLSVPSDRARRFQPSRPARAYLLERLGRQAEAVGADENAIDLTHDPAEREYLQYRRKRITSTRPAPAAQPGAPRHRHVAVGYGLHHRLGEPPARSS